MGALTTEISTKKNKRMALILGLLINIGIFIASFFFGLTQPDPLPEEEFITIAMADLGTTETGSGDVESEVISDNNSPAEETNSTDVEVQSAATDAAPNNLTQTEESTVQAPTETTAEREARERREKIAREKAEREKREQEIRNAANARAQNAFNNNNSGGGSDGGSTGTGNEGRPDGNPAGSGVVGGVGWSMGLDRKPEKLPKPSRNFQEKGKIVVIIYVDKTGKIIPNRTKVDSKKSTSASPVLAKLAIEAANKAKFTSESSAPPMQKGSITYNFTIQ